MKGNGTSAFSEGRVAPRSQQDKRLPISFISDIKLVKKKYL